MNKLTLLDSLVNDLALLGVFDQLTQRFDRILTVPGEVLDGVGEGLEVILCPERRSVPLLEDKPHHPTVFYRCLPDCTLSSIVQASGLAQRSFREASDELGVVGMFAHLIQQDLHRAYRPLLNKRSADPMRNFKGRRREQPFLFARA